MIAVVVVMVVVIMNQFDFVFSCPFCPCVFSCESDLDLHLKRFGDCEHLDLWCCVHYLLEVDGVIAGVDSHGGWFMRSKRVKPIRSDVVRKRRELLKERGFVL